LLSISPANRVKSPKYEFGRIFVPPGQKPGYPLQVLKKRLRRFSPGFPLLSLALPRGAALRAARALRARPLPRPGAAASKKEFPPEKYAIHERENRILRNSSVLLFRELRVFHERL
jgi:hypothetical protein